MEAYKIIEHRNGMKEIVPSKSDLEFAREAETNLRAEMKRLREDYHEARKGIRSEIMTECLCSMIVILMITLLAAALIDIAKMPILGIVTFILVGVAIAGCWRVIFNIYRRLIRLDKNFTNDRNQILMKYGLR